MLHPNSYDADFVAANADILEGDLVLTTFAPFETEVDSDLQDRFFEWTERQGVTVHELTMVGWINADLAFTALLAAGPAVRPGRGRRRGPLDHRLQRRQPDRVDRLEPPARSTAAPTRRPIRWSAAPSSQVRGRRVRAVLGRGRQAVAVLGVRRGRVHRARGRGGLRVSVRAGWAARAGTGAPG